MVDCSKCIHYPVCGYSHDYFRYDECSYYIIRREVVSALNWEYKGDKMSTVIFKECKEGDENE